MQVDESYQTTYCLVKCGLPQASLMGPLLFLYVKDLKNTSPVLDPMLSDDKYFSLTYLSLTYLALTYLGIRQKSFLTVNQELISISQWFASNSF